VPLVGNAPGRSMTWGKGVARPSPDGSRLPTRNGVASRNDEQCVLQRSRLHQSSQRASVLEGGSYAPSAGSGDVCSHACAGDSSESR